MHIITCYICKNDTFKLRKIKSGVVCTCMACNKGKYTFDDPTDLDRILKIIKRLKLEDEVVTAIIKEEIKRDLKNET